MENKKISAAVINRLPRYYRFLSDLLAEGVTRISSDELSRRMRTTASQIRQDLNNFGGFGQQGYGYNVENLKNEIGKLLGLNKSHEMVVIGAGNIGRALAGYSNFEEHGFHIAALFDIDDDLIGREIRGAEVMHVGTFEEFVRGHDVSIAIIAVPRDEAQRIAEMIYRCGIKAIWNFAHVDLILPDDVAVENVHLSESLMKLSYGLNCIDNL
ncbi:MAG: redox-sensing transcriptional repressor Rex [Lachnospiraceae bacterium]|nr:redox-sensing transcriptional repressor Rex [Lachnospiraceae bacterium]